MVDRSSRLRATKPVVRRVPRPRTLVFRVDIVAIDYL